MVERIFDTDNGFWKAVGRLGDLILLTFLTLVCSIPVFTAGAALCAMNYVCFKMIEHDGQGVLKLYFRSFRQNLLQGAAITAVMGIFGFLLWYDGWFLRQLSAGGAGGAALYAGWAVYIYVLFVWITLMLYVFPLQARYYNRLPVTFKSAAVAGFKNLPKTVMMLLGDGFVFLLVILCFGYFMQIAIIPAMVALPLCAWYNAWVLRDMLGLVPGRCDLPVADDDSFANRGLGAPEEEERGGKS